MDIYRIEPDINLCQWLLPVSGKQTNWEDLNFVGKSKAKTWNPPKFYIHDVIKPKCDFYYIGADAFVVTPAVVENPEVGFFFEMAGELLPIETEDGEELFVLNVTECPNAFDKAKSIMRPSLHGEEPYFVEKWAFHADRLTESSIFKVPRVIEGQILTGNILTVTGRGDEEEEFLPTLQRLGIAGLKATRLWPWDSAT